MYKEKESLINDWYEDISNCIFIPLKNNENRELIIGISEDIIDISYIYCINKSWDISVEYRINGSKKINLMREYIKNETLYDVLLDSLRYEILYTILKTANKRNLELEDDYENFITKELNKILN